MLLQTRIPASYILRKVRFEIIYILLIGLVVHYITTTFQSVIPVMPIAVPAFIGTAISVILSFKLNQSYDRWWEARKIWGSIVNDSRSFVLQLQSFVTPDSANAVRQIALRHVAWCYSLSRHLRSQNAAEEFDHLVTPDDLENIKKQQHKPLALLQQNTLQIAELKQSGKMDLFAQVHINNTLVNFSNAMGMAERIKSTVFPVTYRLFLHFFIYVFVITLSIALRDIKSYFEIPLLLVISAAFFLLERSAAHLQDPFMNRPTDTAMSTISRNIEINVKQLIGERDIPEPLAPKDFYSL